MDAVLELRAPELNPNSTLGELILRARTGNDATLGLARTTSRFFALDFEYTCLGDCHSEGTSVSPVQVIENGAGCHETWPFSLKFQFCFQVTFTDPNEPNRRSGVFGTSRTNSDCSRRNYSDAVLEL